MEREREREIEIESDQAENERKAYPPNVGYRSVRP
jgi:hypothetical protein